MLFEFSGVRLAHRIILSPSVRARVLSVGSGSSGYSKKTIVRTFILRKAMIRLNLPYLSSSASLEKGLKLSSAGFLIAD